SSVGAGSGRSCEGAIGSSLEGGGGISRGFNSTVGGGSGASVGGAIGSSGAIFSRGGSAGGAVSRSVVAGADGENRLSTISGALRFSGGGASSTGGRGGAGAGGGLASAGGAGLGGRGAGGGGRGGGCTVGGGAGARSAGGGDPRSKRSRMPVPVDGFSLPGASFTPAPLSGDGFRSVTSSVPKKPSLRRDAPPCTLPKMMMTSRCSSADRMRNCRSRGGVPDGGSSHGWRGAVCARRKVAPGRRFRGSTGVRAGSDARTVLNFIRYGTARRFHERARLPICCRRQNAVARKTQQRMRRASVHFHLATRLC